MTLNYFFTSGRYVEFVIGKYVFKDNTIYCRMWNFNNKSIF